MSAPSSPPQFDHTPWTEWASPALRSAALDYAQQGCYAEAAALMSMIWQRQPTADNLANVGIAQMLANLPDSVATLRQAYSASPTAHTAWHLAQALLKVGRWAEAWPYFNARHQANDEAFPRTAAHDVRPGGNWLLLPEQGYGDMLQFLRFVPHLNPTGKLTLYLPGPLVRLAQLNFPRTTVVNFGQPLPQHDVQLALGDLPGLCDCSPSQVVAHMPYLRVRREDEQHWQQRLPCGFRVGLVWAGNPALAADHLRSIPAALLAPLLALPVSWVNLQVPLQPLVGTFEVAAEELRDFYDTAALISQLDLVVTVDTAVAHLAGALAVPVWLLNRHDSEWRWMTGRADSPWYPTLRIFRQRRPGDWAEVIARVAAALTTLLADSEPAGKNVQQQPNQTADQGAVDPDILQIGADL